ncbi:MAG: lipoprotein-releasing ABC transporter permease subunit [Gammaproteobacteria bacterium]|nr:lipoprotein-releasing ABC transporter permease subunit [Gammaproteobacteria bacterium]MBQ0838717.1 lipoprotein-releasing ABC transporter permease subunit [Gammaproteobacteria bacterium]
MRSYPLFIGRRFFGAGLSRSGANKQLVSFIALLAISGLVLGVALMIIVLSVMNGFDREMRTRVLGVVPHIQLFRPGGIADWQTLGARLAEVPQVRGVKPFTQLDGMLNFRGNTQAVQLLGTTGDGLGDGFSLAAGSVTYPNLSANEILLPLPLAAKLAAKIGDSMTLIIPGQVSQGRQALPNARVFKLAGIYQTHTGIDARVALVGLQTASTLAGHEGRVAGLRLKVDDVFKARQIAYQLLRQLPETFRFTDWLQTHGNLYQAIQMSRKLVGLLVFLVIAIAVFNIVSMLVMTVVEKRGDIAVLKTLGASNSAVLSIFIVQGAMIGVAGTALGVLLGVLGAHFVADIIGLLEGLMGRQFLSIDIYPIDYIPSDLRSTDVLLVALVALALNFFATLYPAWRAARLQPAQVLRYE